MPSSWYSLVVAAADPARLGRWWADVLGWSVVFEAPDEVAIASGPDGFPGMVFLPVPEAKEGKNRLHIDLAPDDQAAEVARLEGAGAKRVDVGQGDASWVVLADPEGNEFCVLTARQLPDDSH